MQTTVGVAAGAKLIALKSLRPRMRSCPEARVGLRKRWSNYTFFEPAHDNRAGRDKEAFETALQTVKQQ